MSNSPSPLHIIPPEILQHIVVLAVTDSPQLGPPSHLLSCLLLSSNIYSKLTANNGLLRAIFARSFDLEAPLRRLGSKYLTSAAIADELKSRCRLLRRFRDPSHVWSDDLYHDFWTAVIMLYESDGRNEAQLFDYAYLDKFIDRWWRLRLHEGKEQQGGYPLDTSVNSLGLYLLWRCQVPETVHRNVASEDFTLLCAIAPFNVACFKYANSYIPEIHYDPIFTRVESPVESRQIAHPYPVYREGIKIRKSIEPQDTHAYDALLPLITHFSLKLRLMPPIITQSTLLIYFTHNESLGIHALSSAPRTRQERDILGFQQPSKEDLDDHNRFANTQFVRRLPSDGSITGSRCFDEDFQRAVRCSNPFDHPFPTAAVYSLGCLSGLWEGRVLFPDYEVYSRLLSSDILPEDFTEFAPMSVPFNIRLKEWYCPTSEMPLEYANNEVGDGLLNAWLPRDADLEERHQKLVIRRDQSHLVYHQFQHADSLEHSIETCSMCSPMSELDSEMSSTDSADESFAASEFSCPKFHDVILTGETDVQHAKAWGGFRFRGRIRPYDGLVVFLRESTEGDAAGHGKWIFRGYLTSNRNFVGRWRDGATDPRFPGDIEGSFTLNKRVEDDY